MSWLMQHKLIAFIIIVLLGAAAWYGLSGSSKPSSILTTQEAPGASAPPGAQGLVESLLALKSVTLSGAIFSNPAFESLQDFSTPIVPEPAGRSNPFAPLAGSAAASSATTQSAHLFAAPTK